MLQYYVYTHITCLVETLSCFVPVCDVLGSHSGRAENSGLLGCDTVVIGEQFRTL